MEHRSERASSAAASGVAPYGKRRHFRQRIQSLTYVNLDQANGGIIRNLSEAGVALQTVTPLRANQQIYLRFDLSNPRTRMEAAGRVAWADAMGQAGVEFLSIPQRSRRQLKEWLFTQLLITAHQGAWESVFLHSKGAAEATQLLFSAAPRAPIRLEAKAAISPEVSRRITQHERNHSQEVQPVRLRVHGFPIVISPRILSGLVDGLILLSAVLLFSVVSLATTHALPAWPVALGLAFGTLCFFAAAYWLLFVICIGTTPGAHLARLAMDSDGMNTAEDERPRFR
jgi:Tfp pilus assembly protein PilZ